MDWTRWCDCVWHVCRPRLPTERGSNRGMLLARRCERRHCAVPGPVIDADPVTATDTIGERIGAAWPLVLPLACFCFLGSGGCGSQNGAGPPAGTGKGYPARSQAMPPAPAAPPQPAPLPAAPVPRPAVAVMPTPVPPPPPAPRAYEPPMPLEPSQSRPLSAAAAAPNAANTTAGGQRFAVRGVDPSDVLNVRSGPSPRHDIVGTIPPDAAGLVPLGGRRQIGPAVWREVSYRGIRGWVNDRFLVEEQSGHRDR